MEATIWGGVSLFSVIMLVAGIFCLLIEMFTIKPGVPAGIGFVLLVIGVLSQTAWIWEAVAMIALICGMFGLLLYAYFSFPDVRPRRLEKRRRYRVHTK